MEGDLRSGNNTIPQGCERNSFTAFFTLTFIIQNILQNYKYPLDTSLVLHYNTTQENFFSVVHTLK